MVLLKNKYIKYAINKVEILKWLHEKSISSSFNKRAEGLPPVFIYQMGKVASSSIYSSIKGKYNGITIHSHSFGQDDNDILVRNLYRLHKEKIISLKIISLIREPISRNVSAFFQNFLRDTGVRIQDSQMSKLEIQDKFLNNYNHSIPLIWFDRNIYKHFEIDVFEYEFPKTGFKIIKKNQVDLLLLKHDLKNSLKEGIIEKFLDIKNFKIQNQNIVSSKIYSELYSEVKKLPLPDYYLDEMLASKYAKHFYLNEIDSIRSKWSIKQV